jgi:flavin-dependent dehydrogenase
MPCHALFRTEGGGSCDRDRVEGAGGGRRDGWFWVIPLAGGRTSIGTRRTAFARERAAHGSTEALYRHLVEAAPTVAALIEGAHRIGPARVETDYSYVAERFCGPGYALVGDAACFLDPLLSTGVHLALFSDLTAAACIASVNRREVTEAEALGFFEYTYRRAYTRLFALVSVMYERYVGRDGFFHTSDRLVGTDRLGTDLVGTGLVGTDAR